MSVFPVRHRPVSARTLAALVLALFVLWFAALAPRHLAKTDEGRYAEIPREMVQSGDWLTPRLNGLRYFEKPALQYWATAAAYEAFGLNEWAARLWTGLTGFLGIICVGATAWRLYGRRTGIYAGAILASSLLYIMLGHINTLDMALTFFMSAGLCTLLLARAAATPARARRWMLACWALFALAVLSKGLIGIVLPSAVVVLYLASTRDWEVLRRVEPWRGPAIFLLVSAPWFIAVSAANPGFAHFFFIHEHFERFLTTSHHREGPWYYFLPILAFGMLPWLASLGWIVLPAWRSATDADSRFRPDRLLLIWCVFIFVFFSASSSKLPSYILPIFPALAILVARYWTDISPRALFRHALVILMLAVGAIALGLNAGHFAHAGETADYSRFGLWVAAAGVIWAAGAIGAILWARRVAFEQAVLTIASASALAGLIALVGYTALDRSASAAYVAGIIAPYIQADTTIYSVNMYEQTLPFYLHRTVTLVNHRDELDYGLTEEPQKWVPTLAAFATVWAQSSHPIAIMPPGTLSKLTDAHLQFRTLLFDRRFVVITK